MVLKFSDRDDPIYLTLALACFGFVSKSSGSTSLNVSQHPSLSTASRLLCGQ